MKAIDLGLSVMWGDCNLGANECYENGNLYKWEDIIPKAERHSIKYDLVEKLCGSGWRVPSKEHLIELMQNCEFEFIPAGRTRLLKATGPNGR